jgi:hypothetical protein
MYNFAFRVNGSHKCNTVPSFCQMMHLPDHCLWLVRLKRSIIYHDKHMCVGMQGIVTKTAFSRQMVGAF